MFDFDCNFGCASLCRDGFDKSIFLFVGDFGAYTFLAGTLLLEER